MSKAFYTVINPVVRTVLRSPIHGLLSRNTLLLEYRGRKSGRTYTIPISYHAIGSRVHCFTEKNNRWWRNLRNGDEVTVTLRGRKRMGKPTTVEDGSTFVQKALSDFLIATPRDAAHAGVAFDPNGVPVTADIERASKRLVLIVIEIN